MTGRQTIGLTLTVWLIVTALAFAVAACVYPSEAHAIPRAQVDRALAELPVYREDRANPYKGAQLYTISQAIASVSRTREEAAFLVTLGYHETKFSFRIHLGICRAYECDNGRALSSWQMHQNGRSEAEWHGFVGLSLEETTAAAAAALGHVRYAMRVCRDEPDPIAAVFRAYNGSGCRQPTPGEAERAMTFRRVIARMR